MVETASQVHDVRSYRNILGLGQRTHYQPSPDIHVDMRARNNIYCAIDYAVVCQTIRLAFLSLLSISTRVLLFTSFLGSASLNISHESSTLLLTVLCLVAMA